MKASSIHSSISTVMPTICRARGSRSCISISLVARSGSLRVIRTTSRIQRHAKACAASLAVGNAFCMATRTSSISAAHAGSDGAAVSGPDASNASSSSSSRCFWYMFISSRAFIQSAAAISLPAQTMSTMYCKRRPRRCARSACALSSAICRCSSSSGTRAGSPARLALMSGSEYPKRFSASMRCSRIRSSCPYRRAPPSVRCDGDSSPIAS